ncbi:MAG: hypothetical protein IKT75_07710, partial [Alistipes sp.]|nr:hypothetical protein [Alistipes sp.]
PAIIKAAVKAESKWLIVEQDQPSEGKTPMECVAMSMEFIKKIKAEGACTGCEDECGGESCGDCGEGCSHEQASCGDSACGGCAHK